MNNFFKFAYFTVRNASPVFNIYLKNKKVLDIGCGTGKLLNEDPENFLGIDKSEKVLKIAAKNNLRVLKADVCYLPFINEKFDAVNCDNVIEHLLPHHAFRLLSEASRVCKWGGVLILRTQMAYREIWETFSHIRPYPPKAIQKLLYSELETYIIEEEENFIKDLSIEDVFYSGRYFKNRFLRNISNAMAFLGPLNRRGYIMILRKIKSQRERDNYRNINE